MAYLSMAANAGRHSNKALVSVTFTARRSVGGSGTERGLKYTYINFMFSVIIIDKVIDAVQDSRVMAASLIGSLSSSPRMEMTLTSYVEPGLSWDRLRVDSFESRDTDTGSPAHTGSKICFFSQEILYFLFFYSIYLLLLYSWSLKQTFLCCITKY